MLAAAVTAATICIRPAQRASSHLHSGTPNAAGTCTKNEMRLWMDGKLLSDQTITRFGTGCVDNTKSEWLAPTFTTVQPGWWNYQPSPIPVEMWLDDVALDTRPITCPTKP